MVLRHAPPSVWIPALPFPNHVNVHPRTSKARCFCQWNRVETTAQTRNKSLDAHKTAHHGHLHLNSTRTDSEPIHHFFFFLPAIKVLFCCHWLIHPPSNSFFFFNLILDLFYVYFACMSTCAPRAWPRPAEVRKGQQRSQNWSHKWLWATCGCWEWNPGPL